ncbi:Sad1 / UNC-like C-terminal [Popillia japonica]|uniref:Sad1 / UNC-like C-terminal n=1 Tax=Popillia japonica TaxID=7064 RepID=A0AAW1IZD5_POPJA
MFKLEGSTSSLTLDEASTPSITSLSSRHSYNTRYSAKLKAAKRRFFLDNDTCLSEKLPPEASLEKPDVELSPKLLVQIRSITSSPSKKKIMPRGGHHPLVSCCQNRSCLDKFCWYLVCFIAIVSLVALSTYILQNVDESNGISYQYFSKELSKMKDQLLRMETEVKEVFNSKADTEKKLETIEGLLKDLKKATQKGTQGSKHDGKGKPLSKEITDALDLYADDRTGKTDFALESAGGRIVDTRDTVSYPEPEKVTFLGVMICTKSNSARAILQPGSLPGECWAFKGSRGCTIIQLLGKVRITGVTLEHISPSMSPSGQITTAPKDFTIKGMQSVDDSSPDLLGKFSYDVKGTRLQYFEMPSSDKAYNLIEFKVLSNHGHPDFTCVYRLRVHGELQS